MTVELRQPLLEPQPENFQAAPGMVSPPPKQVNKKILTVLGALAGGFCLCVVLFIVVVAANSRKTAQERDPVERTLDAFMVEMDARNAKSAYTLISPSAQEQIPLTLLQELVTGDNYALFEGYQSLSVQTFTIKSSVNTNPENLLGSIANYTGAVTYKGGFTGQITATLEKVDGLWMLLYVHVVVPPEKLPLSDNLPTNRSSRLT